MAISRESVRVFLIPLVSLELLVRKSIGAKRVKYCDFFKSKKLKRCTCYKSDSLLTHRYFFLSLLKSRQVVSSQAVLESLIRDYSLRLHLEDLCPVPSLPTAIQETTQPLKGKNQLILLITASVTHVPSMCTFIPHQFSSLFMHPTVPVLSIVPVSPHLSRPYAS